MTPSTLELTRDLTNDTFKDFVEQNNMVLVAFVLPFLHGFQRFMREYQEVKVAPRFVDVRKTNEEGVLGSSTIVWLWSPNRENRLRKRG
jgi:hypothetical protein